MTKNNSPVCNLWSRVHWNNSHLYITFIIKQFDGMIHWGEAPLCIHGGNFTPCKLAHRPQFCATIFNIKIALSSILNAHSQGQCTLVHCVDWLLRKQRTIPWKLYCSSELVFPAALCAGCQRAALEWRHWRYLSQYIVKHQYRVFFGISYICCVVIKNAT